MPAPSEKKVSTILIKKFEYVHTPGINSFYFTHIFRIILIISLAFFVSFFEERSAACSVER